MVDELSRAVQQHEQWIIQLRRYFRAHPEVSDQEFATQDKLEQELAQLGIAVRKAGKTGLIAEIHGRGAGKTVALRADIDALPVQDQCGKDYQSQNPGVSHACGHDGHMAMLLGIARVLTAMKDQWDGTVRLLFQPAEESLSGGALSLIKDGALQGVDVILGAHLWQPFPIGKLALTAGSTMASADEFIIRIIGRGGHGSMPHLTIDPVLVGSEVVCALHSIVGRSINALQPSVLSVGMFHSGKQYNIIPQDAVLNGTIRALDESVRQQLFDRIEQVTAGICSAHGACYEYTKRLGCPPVVNHAAVVDVVAAAGQEVLGDNGVMRIQPVMASEDFAFYLQQVPGAYVFIGIGNEQQGIVYPHHHPQFDMDERALGYGTEILVRSTLKLLAGQQ